MAIRNTIIDPETGREASVVDGAEVNALAVATRPLKTFENKDIYFQNETYGAEMNQNVATGGTPIHIHDGTDNIYWTASAISGNWVFDSTDQNHTPAGSKSIDATGTTNNSIAQIAKGSSQDLTGYVSITGWIYISSWSAAGTKHIELYGWDTGTGLIVGNSVNIDDYINTGQIGSWQKFTINLKDFGIKNKTIDSIRIQTTTTAVAPNYYLDDIQIEETGAPLEYNIQPETDTWLHIHEISMVLADAYTGTITGLDDGTENTTMQALSYNKILGVSELDSGIIYKHTANGNTKFSYNMKSLADILDNTCSRIITSGSDRINTFIKICFVYTEPIILKWEEMDKLSFTISDDLSGLLRFRIKAGCKEEKR